MIVNIRYHRSMTTLELTDVTDRRDASSGDAVSCCAPLVREPLDAAKADDLAHKLKALADPARLRLISIVGASEGAEACVCDLTEPIGLSQPTVSHHLKVLMDAGFLTRSKRGTWAYYKLVPESLAELSTLLTDP